MKKFLMAMVALSFALAAAGCGRSDPCTEDPCLCEESGGVLREVAAPSPPGAPERELQGDLVRFDRGGADMIIEQSGEPGKYAAAPPPAAPQPAPPKVVVPPPGAEPEARNGSAASEEDIIRDIIANGYGDVPAVIADGEYAETEYADEYAGEYADGEYADEAYADEVYADGASSEEGVPEEPVAEEEARRGMMEDYRTYMDIDAYVAGESPEESEPALPEAEDFVEHAGDIPIPIVDAPEAPETPAVPSMQDVAELPDAPAIAPIAPPIAPVPEPAIEEKAILPDVVAAAEEAEAAEDFSVASGRGEERASPFLAPPPLFGAVDAVDMGKADAGEKRELSLDGFDDMDLEYFGSISESLLNSGS